MTAKSSNLHPDQDLTTLSAVQVVDLLKRGDVSPVELVDAAASRIEACEPVINALPIRFLEKAREKASKFRRTERNGSEVGWLAGLPIAVKDYNDVEGERTTFGSPIYADRVAAKSDNMVARLISNGAIPLAKSNVPEFGGANTFNSLFGATRNPWDPRLSAGGSSGGSAAALAAGEVWLATGSDLGGSLRIPASFCGVVAVRPSVGRVPRPDWALPFDSLGSEGPMGRNVADTALMLDALTGPMRGDPFGYGAQPASYLAALDHDPGSLKLAYSPDLGLATIDPAVVSVTQAVVAQLEAPGIEVFPDGPDISGSIETFETLRAFLFATLHGELARTSPDKLPPWILANFQKGLSLTAEEMIRAERTRQKIFRNVSSFFETYDALICPAVAVAPFPVEQAYPTEIAGRKLSSYLDWMFLTFSTTLWSCPIVALPCGLNADGLPIGLQIIGAPGTELRLLQLARRIEQCAGVSSQLPLLPV